ncbi:MAG: GerMN domain-containing protein [Candidatus Caenarcaniphilales bacterium]|nr:GerMN domain-containing protein [Candidatus Caenarcaniphilales bacterium]
MKFLHSLQLVHKVSIFVLSLIVFGCSVQPTEQLSEEKAPENSISIYFVKADKNSKDASLQVVYRPLVSTDSSVKTETNTNIQLKQALNSLLAGPTEEETEKNIGSEIPEGSKLLQFNESKDKITVNLSEKFVSGGGSRSMLLRYQQLEQTIQKNSQDKPVFVEIEGKPLKRAGGEGLVTDDPIYKGKNTSASEKDTHSVL